MHNCTYWHRYFRTPLLGAAFLLLFFTKGWTQTKPIEGIRENTPKVHALVNARIVQAPGRVIEKGTIVLRDGTIEAVGAGVKPPADARVWDYEGLTIYPGLIESYSHLGLAKEKKKPAQSSPGGGSQNSKTGAKHWNQYVTPEADILAKFKPKEEDLKKLRSLGFTAAVIAPDKGVFSGASVLVSLDNGSINDQLLKRDVAQNIMFKRPGSRRFGGGYPSSQMGVIALIRQTLLDADWYRKAQAAYLQKPNGQRRPEANESLAALEETVLGKQLVLISIEDDLNFLRAAKIVKAFNLNAMILGSGHEYRQLELVMASGLPVILPVNFPEAPDVESPEDALNVSLQELSHWEAAPGNPARLLKSKIRVALTTAKLKKPADFYKQIRLAIKAGLSESDALTALTTTPASLLGMQSMLGSVDTGKLGHLVVTDGDLFKEKTKILDVWIDGNRHEIKKRPDVDPRGKWQLTLNLPNVEGLKSELELKGEVEKLSGSLLRDSTTIELKNAKVNFKRLTLTFPGKELGFDGVIRMSGVVEKNKLSGHGELPDGSRFTWLADSREAVKADSTKPEEKSSKPAEMAKAPSFPPGAYGRTGPPEQPKAIFVKGATIWTSGPKGIIENGSLLINRGKISKIGKGLKAPSGAMVIDAKGKHVTPGLIDAHSHSGLSSINEGSQAVTAEVSVGDVINSYDIALYRELAGGLTAANQLHGSANPIGGKNSVIKLRWGSSPDALKIKDAIPGIKFALGENVKRSRSSNNKRYPDTRMGVEQIIRDRFKAALDYERKWQKFSALKKKNGVIPPRRDLELDTLLEIIHGKRLVHSHSYRQDEILMLVRIAEDFGFQIGTFQHVLEGYKVAEVLAKHGAGASTFSDWWAYKFEVYDAIPYNGALMHNAGVVVSFNSDSGELARRMNLEAAKAVKYGGVSEEEALKFVTLNPAKQLRIDHRVGSLEVGKDADFVIWSGSPLSTYSKCEQTWIEGRKYFDIEEDMKMRELVVNERARLIQKVFASEEKGKSKKKKSEAKPTY
ncbi:amidohydrolase family protein [candidate division KSB1 bacterium]|nr:amidohydrolase family protein [candidate division KSB1 bacterium]